MLVKNPGATGMLEPEEVADPVPGDRDVIVKVGAVGVNFSGSMVRLGYFGPAPRIPGLEIAGTVVEVGAGVSRVPIGARVVLNPAVTCGRCAYCRSGNHGTCRQRSALGQARDGGYAEYVAVPVENVHELAGARVIAAVGSEAKRQFILSWGGGRSDRLQPERSGRRYS